MKFTIYRQVDNLNCITSSRICHFRSLLVSSKTHGFINYWRSLNFSVEGALHSQSAKMVPPFLTYAIFYGILQASDCNAENVLSQNTYFKRVDEDATKESDDVTMNQITEAFFECGTEGACTNVTKSKMTGESKALSNKAESNQTKDPSEVWQKVIPIGKGNLYNLHETFWR